MGRIIGGLVAGLVIALAALLGVHDDVAAAREAFPRLCSA